MEYPSIYFMRHAESLFNRYGSQEKDCAITSEGQQQASQVNGHYDLVVCSPMLRCRQTLSSSKITYDKIIYDVDCREHMTSNCDFLDHEEIKNESKNDLYTRINKLREKLLEYSKNYKKILVLSHYVFINHYTYGQLRLKNTEIQQNRVV